MSNVLPCAQTNQGSLMLRVSALCLATLLAAGCTNTLKYDDASQAPGITQTISHDELKQLAGKMADSMSQNTVVMSYTYARKPSLAIDPLVNLTGRNIDMSAATAAITDKLKSLDVYQIETGSRVSNARQSAGLKAGMPLDNSSDAQRIASRVGSDLFLYGEVSELIRTRTNTREVFVRISLRLMDKATGKVVWFNNQDVLKSKEKVVFGV